MKIMMLRTALHLRPGDIVNLIQNRGDELLVMDNYGNTFYIYNFGYVQYCE